jgi:hypothetical protein
MSDRTRQRRRRLFFIYAWPVKNPKRSRRKPPKPAFKGAKNWQNNVYYFWWEYLRRHEGYLATCASGGKGRYADLYSDFGDVRAPDFWRWWNDHAELFAEPLPPHVQIVALNDGYSSRPNTVLVEIPLDQRLALSVRQLRRMIADKVQMSPRSRSKSRARYPVYTKPVVSTLYHTLRVWDIRQEHPNWPNYLVKDVADGVLSVSDAEAFISSNDRKLKLRLAGTSAERIQKTLAVSRVLRIARQYIDNVALGVFPKRTRR